MGGGKSCKVDGCNVFEEIPGVEDSQQVAGDKAAHRIPGHRKPGDCASFGRKLVYLLVDL